MFHFDKGTVVDGILYSAHSNRDEWPMTSSVEMFDTRRMKHIGTHSFGIRRGSAAWIDWHEGYGWMTFANYNRFKDRPDPKDPDGYDVLPGHEDGRVKVSGVYGYKHNTQLCS